MAIKNKSGERCTPKQFVAELLAETVKGFVLESSELTDKEFVLATQQAEKYRERLLKVLGHGSSASDSSEDSTEG